MLSLDELQKTFAAVSLGADTNLLADYIITDGLSAKQRLSIHRTNTSVLLGDALGATYAVVKKLVGEDFFSATTRSFVRAKPPHSPCLFEYGEAFADFITTLSAAQKLPYLADVARLEWLWNLAFHAADATPLRATDMTPVAATAYGDVVFDPHPSLELISSPFPIKEIWDINQNHADPNATVSLDEGHQALAIIRPHTAVQMIELSSAGFILAQQLKDGVRLEDAFAAAQDLNPDPRTAFDPAPTLAALIGAGAFQAYALKAS